MDLTNEHVLVYFNGEYIGFAETFDLKKGNKKQGNPQLHLKGNYEAGAE